MDIAEIILGVLIFGNILRSVVKKNWNAACGWLIAGLEWTRRL